MLLGTAGVGKTSFKRGLMKLPWDPKTDSTLVSDIDTLRPVGYQWETMERQKRKWRVATEEDNIDELAHLLAAVYSDPDSSMNLLSTVAALSLYHIESLACDSTLSEKEINDIHKSKVSVLLSKAIERARRIIPSTNINPRPFLHVWDCGGQPVFLEILPAFLTARSMFLLLFDASKNVEEKWKSIRTMDGRSVHEDTSNNTTQNLLFNWMANIHHHLAQKDEMGGLRDYPRIYCIGTHGDLIGDQEREEIKTKLKESYKSKAFSYLIDNTLIVDNTTAGEGKEDVSFKTVRDEILNFTCHKLVVKAPLSWVLFRNVVQALDAKVISLEEAHAIGVACKIPHSDVSKALLFYHDLGAILYYPNIEGMKDKVIINPKWFVGMLGKIFTLEGREKFQTEAMWVLLREKGILVQDLYVAAWRNCRYIRPNDFMELLVHFRLAVEVKTKLYFDANATQFFLPAVLKSFNGNTQEVEALGYLFRATFLHITFSTQFVPPGFFTRFVTSLASSDLCELYFDDGVFRNRVTLKFGKPCIDHMTLTDLGYAIQVDVSRYVHTEQPFNKACQKILTVLKEHGKNVDELLNTISSVTPSNYSIKTTRDYQFVCASDKCKASELHYIVHAHGQTCNLQLTCMKKRGLRYPETVEAYWFAEEETTEKVGQHK